MTTLRRPKARHGQRSLPLVLIPALTVGALGLGSTAFATDFPIVPISGLSPYPEGADCNGTPQTGTVWRNSETEPYMDVDFGRPENMAAIVHQDRWSNGGAQSTATFYSEDGGESWTLAKTPITRCSGGLQEGPESFDRASDPWLTVTLGRIAKNSDGGGNADKGGGAIFHQMNLMIDTVPPFTGELRSAYSMLRSKDGGKTWSDPIIVNNLTEFDEGAPFNDKNTMTADPYRKRFIYATWQLLKNVLPDDDSAIPLEIFYSDSLFVRSRDMGRSWEPARSIYEIRNDTDLLAASGIDIEANPLVGKSRPPDRGSAGWPAGQRFPGDVQHGRHRDVVHRAGDHPLLRQRRDLGGDGDRHPV